MLKSPTMLETKRIADMDVYFRTNDEKIYKYQPLELERIIKHLTGEEFETYEGGKYRRRLVNPDNFEILGKYPHDYGNYDYDNEEITDKYTCLCGENTCSYLVIVRYKPTDIYMALGSVCYTRFNEENISDVYYHCKAKKCNCCKIPLVFKQSKYTKNTDKYCNDKCFTCYEKKKMEKQQQIQSMNNRVYLNVSYADKNSDDKCFTCDKIKKMEEEQQKKIMNDRVYLNVSYADKDDAKSLGAWWDADKKKWYAPNGSSKYKILIEKYK